MPNLAWIVEESVWEDFDCGREPMRQVRFIRIREGENRGEKRYEIFLESGDIVATRVIPEGAVCAEYLKQALQESVANYTRFEWPMPSDLQIGCLDGRIRTKMEYEYEDKKVKVTT